MFNKVPLITEEELQAIDREMEALMARAGANRGTSLLPFRQHPKLSPPFQWSSPL